MEKARYPSRLFVRHREPGSGPMFWHLICITFLYLINKAWCARAGSLAGGLCLLVCQSGCTLQHGSKAVGLSHGSRKSKREGGQVERGRTRTQYASDVRRPRPGPSHFSLLGQERLVGIFSLPLHGRENQPLPDR